MDTEAIQKYTLMSEWYKVLEEADCTPEKISDEINAMQAKKDVPILLNVALAYNQLSNIRWIDRKNKKSNALEANTCFVKSIDLYSRALDLDSENVMAYQSGAYAFYKYIIDHFGVNKAEVKRMGNVDLVECFDKTNDMYDKLFALEKLAPTSELKARYRRGKMWAEVYLNPIDKMANKIRANIRLTRSAILNHAIDDLKRAIELHDTLTKKEDKASVYDQYIKAWFSLGRLYDTSVFDNSNSDIVINGKNTTIFNEFVENPETVDLASYRPARSLYGLGKAEEAFLHILDEYHIEPYKKLDFKKLVSESKYPISPRDVFYRLGTLYMKWFLVKAIPARTNKRFIGRAYTGIYFLFAANEFCCWCEELHIPHAKFKYVGEKLIALLAASGINWNTDSHIKNMLAPYPKVFTQP